MTLRTLSPRTPIEVNANDGGCGRCRFLTPGHCLLFNSSLKRWSRGHQRAVVCIWADNNFWSRIVERLSGYAERDTIGSFWSGHQWTTWCTDKHGKKRRAYGRTLPEAYDNLAKWAQ